MIEETEKFAESDVIAKGEDANTEGTKQEMHELKQDSIKLFETLHARNNNSQQSSSSSEG
ncbi:19025_t:CDS:2 [Entrophospora sp. SA101]|nr:6377_t:CDS:2 [Entrophospora sp. SA101]CAJ0630318.1 6130_t:CDS:2 [Entrophospora sp. SA101]CAJ0751503.1 15778_t:CDS:2 [Entrophospora sp. SA101]CAJ0762164.1 19025_t:CDS:2 [Entrophospora sp. SA101]CAJ0832635.1 16337_t:CDS:2 [Entrophospora sp. SA101]